MTDKKHWDTVYGARGETALTWFEEEARISLDLIARHATPNSAVLDVGGGASRLVDGLLDRGFADITVLDLSEAALATSRDRLGARAAQVEWLAADVTLWTPGRAYDLWHDRAVFHFMTTAADRAAYVRALKAALRPGGTAIIATFALDGPETCSNLPVQRYSPQTLAETLEALAPGAFDPVEARAHAHRTPMGRSQSFQISVLRRR